MRRWMVGGVGALAALVLLASGSCSAGSPDTEDRAMPSDTVSYLALGDSYTIGESVDSSLRWPVQLAGLLDGEGVPTRPPIIVARTGWTTDELLSGIETADVAGTFDLVSLLIGVNNQYRGRDLGEYRVQFVDLLTRAIRFAGGNPERVLVLSIPDWGVTPFAEGRNRAEIAEEIDAFNEVNRTETEEAGAAYLDITGISREAAADPALVAEDGLHPSGAMYSRWARDALPLARRALGTGEEGGS